MTAHTYAVKDRLSCGHGHPVEVLWSNPLPPHLSSEVS